MSANTNTYTMLAFGSAVEVLGWRERAFDTDGRTLSAVLDELERGCPLFAEARARLRLAINEHYVTADAVPQPGDEVALIPPVAGGEGAGRSSPRGAARLTRDPLDPAALLPELACGEAGAQTIFVGVVRREQSPAGQTLVALDYSAYEPMALGELQRLTDEACAEFDLLGARVAHRLGRLEIGEASIVVAVAAAHRGAALDGCRALIERLKVSVPIFKREIWADGSHSWVDPT